MAAIRVLPDGSVRAIYEDSFPFLEALGQHALAQRRRASLILTIETGPRAGHFYADMSYLADLTGNDAHRVCLLATSFKEEEVKAAERSYLEVNFL